MHWRRNIGRYTLGKLIVVGIGPGDYENMTVRADRALQNCDVIIGYTVYVDLVRDRYPDKEFFETPMTRETERCQIAIDEARKGKTVAMVCSGDSGIYGMAALIYELRGESKNPEVEVIPLVSPVTVMFPVTEPPATSMAVPSSSFTFSATPLA